MKKTLQEIAAFVQGRLAGDPAIEISGVTNIMDAGRGELTFAVEPHIEAAKGCAASAVLLPEAVGDFPLPAIYVAEPRAAFAALLELFTPPLEFPAGISEQRSLPEPVDVRLYQVRTWPACAGSLAGANPPPQLTSVVPGR